MDDIIRPDFGEETVPIVEDLGDIVKKVNKDDTLNDLGGDNNIASIKKNELNHDGSISQLDSYKANVIEENEDNEDFEDETLVERLIGLTEMFPENLRNLTWKLSNGSLNFAKGLYEFSRSAFWIISTSAIILAVPTLIESEKSQLEEMNRQQQRQILLGPNASATSNLMPTLTPPQPIK